jgi:hypothetical protein
MPLVGFEPMILVSERPKTHALDRTVTGIGCLNNSLPKNSSSYLKENTLYPHYKDQSAKDIEAVIAVYCDNRIKCIVCAKLGS